MSVRPTPYKWAQRRPDFLYITIPGIFKERDVKVTLTPEGELTFVGKKDNDTFSLGLRLNGRLRVEDSSWHVGEREVKFKLRKDSPLQWKSLQKSGIQKPPYEKVDWDLWQESDDDDMKDDGMPAHMRGFGASEEDPWLLSAMEFLGGMNWMDMVVLFSILLPVLLAPYTKVEESFNLQATHDLLFHDVNLSEYDHFIFPGVVPRTFLGPIVLAVITSPLAFVVRMLGLPKIVMLYMVRLALGTLSWLCYRELRKQLLHKFDEHTATAFGLFTVTQFHLPFYMSRTLPNTFALNIIMLAYAEWFKERYHRMIALFAFSAVVFRGETALLGGFAILLLLARQRIGVLPTLRVGILASAASLALTVAVDSIFWKRLAWPEGEVMYFNVYLNKSHEWGVSPFHWYFTSALPKMLLAAAPLAIAGVATDYKRLWPYVTPVIAFVAVYSYLPHKEARFIFYAVPMLNVAAALAVAKIWRQGRGAVAIGICVLMLGASFAATGGLLYVSALNYPGGEAFAMTHAQFGNRGLDGERHLHLAVAACMTGVSHFGEYPQWKYNKDEYPQDYSSFSHMITPNATVAGFHQVANVTGFDRIELLPILGVKILPWVTTSPKMFIHENDRATDIAPAMLPSDDHDSDDNGNDGGGTADESLDEEDLSPDNSDEGQEDNDVDQERHMHVDV